MDLKYLISIALALIGIGATNLAESYSMISAMLGIVLLLVSLIFALINFAIGRSPSADPPAQVEQPPFDRDKIEELRARALDLRDIAWGYVPTPQAKPLIDAFTRIAEDFVREPEFADIVRLIDGGATRMAIMASRPPAGPNAADPVAQNKCRLETHQAIDDLLALTDPYVNRQRSE